MDRDLVVGIAGAVLLVVAMIGVFAFESDNAASGSQTFDVQWPNRSGSLDGGQGNLNEGDCRDITAPIGTANLTRVTFSVTWQDDTGSPDTFNATATAPGGSPTRSAEATNDNAGSGTILLEFDLGDVPSTSTVNGDDAADARENLADQNTRTNGQGDWTLTVCLTDAPGTSAPVPGLPEVQADGSNSFEWGADLEFYEGDVSAQ